MNCPVCKSSMLTYDTPGAPGESVAVDRCEGPNACGVWYDAKEYAAVHPRLAEPEVRDALLTNARTADGTTTRPVACPRCAESGGSQQLARITFVGVRLGYCEACAGLWAPHGAVTELSNALALYTPATSEAPGNYRESASRPVMTDAGVPRARCAGCRQVVALHDTLLSEHGPMCVVCASKLPRETPYRPVETFVEMIVQLLARTTDARRR